MPPQNWLISYHYAPVICHIRSAAANLLTPSHPHQAHHLMGQRLHCSLHLLPRHISENHSHSHSEINWKPTFSKHQIFVVMIILLNKHRLSWSGTYKWYRVILGMDRSTGTHGSNCRTVQMVTLSQAKQNKKNKFKKIKTTVPRWLAAITPVNENRNLLHKSWFT